MISEFVGGDSAVLFVHIPPLVGAFGQCGDVDREEYNITSFCEEGYNITTLCYCVNVYAFFGIGSENARYDLCGVAACFLEGISHLSLICGPHVVSLSILSLFV